jgi:hypothetical protein
MIVQPLFLVEYLLHLSYMKTRIIESGLPKNRPTLDAAQVQATVAASGLSRLEFAERVGCGTSQLFKYQKEGLPPRMNAEVKQNILSMAVELGVIPKSAQRSRK